jgi:hypothetical protein
MSELDNYRAEMSRLVRARSRAVDSALAQIKAANREFDRKAVPLARKIIRLENEEKVEHSTISADALDMMPVAAPRSERKRTAQPRFTTEDGFTQEEIDTYYSLKQK